MGSSIVPLVKNVVDGVIIGDRIVVAVVELLVMEELVKLCCKISPSSVLCNSFASELGISCCSPVKSCLEKSLGSFGELSSWCAGSWQFV